jgi:hypothetical protein
MPKIGRPGAEVVVSDDESAALVRLTKRARVNRAVAFRARILLASIDRSDTAVARRLRTTRTTVASGADSSSNAGSHRARHFVAFLRDIDSTVEPALDITSSSTICSPTARRHPRLR